jgi:alpha-beta hydrolase superfamily lysophospholipase
MNHSTGNYRTPDGAVLFTQQWLPEGVPQAAVFLIHGLAEHSGRYQHVAAFLTARGYAVYTMDLRGHGQSEGLRGHIDNFEVFLDDLSAYFRQIETQTGGPWFVLGHSIGATLSTIFVSRHQDRLAGMIISGVALSPGESIPANVIKLSSLLSRIAPKLPVKALDAAAVSRDPAVQRAYDTDPLNYRGKIRARMAAELLRMLDVSFELLPQITIPALAMHGSDDLLVDPAGLDAVYSRVRSADKTRHLFEGLYHEILNEPEKDEVMGIIAEWLDKRLV